MNSFKSEKVSRSYISIYYYSKTKLKSNSKNTLGATKLFHREFDNNVINFAEEDIHMLKYPPHLYSFYKNKIESNIAIRS